ncbi:phage gene 29 protein family protein [Corynebacterium pseudopelargi]|uniref:Minor tail protein n=1 Tax=Corynebacterium pseudopelargi TaxID=2080757 RepID=A0A3G6IST1_9CORY|nr:DUF2744 domain-containing protein [Corynebacterium pseudopelargi]AZA08692.1 hypothetical protein CPPEL_02805 [Corynebacterium pseudopelargi]
MIPVDQTKADMSDPEQHFGWAVASIPPVGYNPDLPNIVFPLLYLPWLSQFLWDCGFRHHPELQVIRQRVDESAPLRNAGVQWERIPNGEAVATPQPTGVDLTTMSDEDAQALLEALKARLNL